MGDGTSENPYTREDVLRLIEENGGKAKGLDLSGKHFEEGIDLSKLDLAGIALNNAILFHSSYRGEKIRYANLEGANLMCANLQGAILSGAHLERAKLWNANLEGADLRGAHLESAVLIEANLEEAELGSAHLEETDLRGARLDGAYWQNVEFTSDTKLDDVYWGSYVLGQESFGDIFLLSTYRRLRSWYAEHGMNDIAAKFYYREMEAKRKAMKWWPNPLPKIQQTLYWLFYGYGEVPWRVFSSAVVVVFGLAAIYFAIGTLTPNTFLNSLYYSAVSFTALGYGSWAPQPTGWVKGLGALEAFIGVFMIALFLITFVRKMTR